MALWGKNILDNRNFVYSNPVFVLALSGNRRPPATYGVSGSVKF